jgi:glycosyltransferase involved in cell wall biosynthesis
MIRIGIVVQRYGQDVVGGAETLARDVAERLQRVGFDVTVFTTTAMDYISWKNQYSAGETILKGVRILRYQVEKERHIEEFNQLSDKFFQSPPAERHEQQWIIEQGPYCPQLIDALSENRQKIDCFIFFTYLYYPTIEGLKVVKKPSILFPTAHDEAPIYMQAVAEMFKKPDCLCFLTESEMKLVERLFQPAAVMNLLRTGMMISDHADETQFRKKFGLVAPYVLYAGRIEKGKGVDVVFSGYAQLERQHLLNLVLIGKLLMPLPKNEGIHYLGFVSEAEKLAAFKGARFSIQPSPMESLSITTLESFSQKTPVLVNRQSLVLDEHIRLSGGGLGYQSQAEFIDQALCLLENSSLRKQMGQAGYAYVKKYFSWEVVILALKQQILQLIK